MSLWTVKLPLSFSFSSLLRTALSASNLSTFAAMSPSLFFDYNVSFRSDITHMKILLLSETIQIRDKKINKVTFLTVFISKRSFTFD